MAEQNPSSVLRRKADAGTQEHQARAMTVAKAMRLGIARVADTLLDLPLSAIGIVVERRGADACAELMPQDGLLMLLDGPRGRVGAAILAQDLAGGLIQQQTMGLVRPATGDTRTMTDTDAALAAPLIDALLARAAREVEAPSDRAVLEGVSFGSRAEEPRMVMMALEEQDFMVIRLTLDMAKGARQGDLVLILPPVPPDGGGQGEDDEGEAPSKADGARRAYTDLVFGLEAHLRMEICTLSLPLAGASKLAAGEILPLPAGTFPKAKIVGTDGRCVGTGTIGQVDGIRALRLDPDPIYARQPRRRASDREELDLPDVTPLAGDGDADAAASPGALPALPNLGEMAAIEASAALPDLPEADSDAPDLSTLPDLPDLDTPEPRSASGPVDMELPDLDDLPDLSDLPELGELPQIDISEEA